jgi:hypothetical protein
MAAMTADVIVDRVRSICTGASFGFIEAESWNTFELQPTTNLDGVFRIPPPSSQVTRGQFGYVEDRTDTMQIWLARLVNADFDAVRRLLLQDMHALTAAVIRDAHEDSGDYTVPDEGRGHAIYEDPGKAYVALRLTLPINYEAQL